MPHFFLSLSAYSPWVVSAAPMTLTSINTPTMFKSVSLNLLSLLAADLYISLPTAHFSGLSIGTSGAMHRKLSAPPSTKTCSFNVPSLGAFH